MTPYHDANGITIYHGDCLEVMRGLPDASVDSVVTDPPYGLSFMGKRWDYDVPAVAVWREALRVLKPGGHLIAFGGSRTYHRLAVNVEDAGFDIRDQVLWVYATGFPKSLDVSKAIDKEAGADREVVGSGSNFGRTTASSGKNALGDYAGNWDITSPTTDAAKQWDGWHTALKPSHEPAVLARKPFPGTVAQNVQAYGTGALNVDGCRVSGEDTTTCHNSSSYMTGKIGCTQPIQATYTTGSTAGRWPANLIHDGSPEVVALFPVTGPAKRHVDHTESTSVPNVNFVSGSKVRKRGESHDDNGGSASRFFYCAKASPAERGPGNNHPTVKPIALMRYLCRLVTPPGGVVLDPFAGSGTTGIAARLEGFRAVLCEREASYLPIITGRLGCEVVQDAAGGATLRPAPQDQLSLFDVAA